MAPPPPPDPASALPTGRPHRAPRASHRSPESGTGRAGAVQAPADPKFSDAMVGSSVAAARSGAVDAERAGAMHAPAEPKLSNATADNGAERSSPTICTMLSLQVSTRSTKVHPKKKLEPARPHCATERVRYPDLATTVSKFKAQKGYNVGLTWHASTFRGGWRAAPVRRAAPRAPRPHWRAAWVAAAGTAAPWPSPPRCCPAAAPPPAAARRQPAAPGSLRPAPQRQETRWPSSADRGTLLLHERGNGAHLLVPFLMSVEKLTATFRPVCQFAACFRSAKHLNFDLWHSAMSESV